MFDSIVRVLDPLKSFSNWVLYRSTLYIIAPRIPRVLSHNHWNTLNNWAGKTRFHQESSPPPPSQLGNWNSKIVKTFSLHKQSELLKTNPSSLRRSANIFIPLWRDYCWMNIFIKYFLCWWMINCSPEVGCWQYNGSSGFNIHNIAVC